MANSAWEGTVRLFIAIALVVFFGGFVAPVASAQTTTIIDARVGVTDESPYAATYHLVEVFQFHGRWIVPDVGYIDFADAKHYREWFVGAGYKLLVTKYVTVAEELYFVQAAGPESESAKYLQLWTGVFYTFTSKFGGETAFFPYIPLNRAGRKQWVLERTKLEYAFIPALKVGAGYGAYQLGDELWQHKPFVTTTLAPVGGKFGSLELWYQWLPDGKGQVQIRYEVVRITTKKK